jgi:uncharacterized protein
VEQSFEWDPEKERINIAKHGCDFRTAQRAFFDKARIIAEDLGHGDREKRWFCFGAVDNNVLTVRFAMRGGRIRIIGAG